MTYWRWVPTLQQQQSCSDSTSTHMKVNVAATLSQKMSSVSAYFTKLRRWFRPREEPGQERHAACVPETAGNVSSVYPQWCQGFDTTFAKGIKSITHARRIARSAPYESTRSLFPANNDPGTPIKVVVVAVVHHISRATVRPGPSNAWAA